MNPVLLIDFGSTYTKVTAVDTDAPALLGVAGAHTTVQTDVGDGLAEAMRLLTAQTGSLDFTARYACSSAAGGLRMVACGLVPSLTVEAAKRAALGAGAKVLRVYSYELTQEDITEIDSLAPDILLLTGGTDGGNRQNALQNAQMLKNAAGDFPIIYAGNRVAAASCMEALSGGSHEVIRCDNVMPAFNQLHIEPVQQVIRDLFLARIIRAKGLSAQQALVDGILMPTPAAVMDALTLLSTHVGDLVCVDLGGATTDVYSLADGLPQGASTILRGLPEPHAKRTVEGDIGMRYSAQGIVESAGMARITALSGLSEEMVRTLLQTIADTPGILPSGDDALARLDYALACCAIDTALTRHAGTLETVYTPTGMMQQQTGKDLTSVPRLLLTGGAIVHGGAAADITAQTLAAMQDVTSLKPRSAQPYLDKHYILAAMGLLSLQHPEAALTLMQTNICIAQKEHGDGHSE